ncbi:MAG: PAS domain-containing protein [Alphaproteobacteria bacterium]
MSNMTTIRATHPTNATALRYWETKRGGRAMPARADLDPCEIPELLPHVVLIDVAHDPVDFRYRLIGTNVDHHLWEPRTGQWLSQVPGQGRDSAFWQALADVAASGLPASGRIAYVGPHRDYDSAEDLIMPLSSDGDRVDMLFVTIAYEKKGSWAC